MSIVKSFEPSSCLAWSVRYRLPPIEIDPAEAQIWEALLLKGQEVTSSQPPHFNAPFERISRDQSKKGRVWENPGKGRANEDNLRAHYKIYNSKLNLNERKNKQKKLQKG